MRKGVLLLLVPFVLIGSLLTGALFVGGAQQPEDECGIGGDPVAVSVANLPKSIGPYSGEQLENAALIINAGKKMAIPRRGQAIAVMTATVASTTFVASQRPPIPVSTTATSTGASAKAA